MKVTEPSVPSISKYLRVFPILGLLFYYIGGLITSLEVPDIVLFLAQTILLSSVLLIGLAIMIKKLVIAGAVLLILGSVGIIAAYLLALGVSPIGAGALGGSIMAFAILFHILTIRVWIME